MSSRLSGSSLGERLTMNQISTWSLIQGTWNMCGSGWEKFTQLLVTLQKYKKTKFQNENNILKNKKKNTVKPRLDH